MEFTFVKRWFQNTSPCCLCKERRRIGETAKYLPPFLCKVCFVDLECLPFGTDVWQTEAAEQLLCNNIDGLAVISTYGWPYDGWLTKLKFHQQLYLSLTLGYLMARQIEQQAWDQIDLICALPLHKRRESKRGYNQAKLLLDAVVTHLRHSISEYQGLIRRTYTKPQTELNRLERKLNTQKAFVCIEPILDKRILLIDDVITTGSSIESATTALKNAGAKQVYVACGALRILI